MSNTLKFGNGEWYGKEGTILAYNSENNNYKPLPFTFDRASSATRVNKDGLIETVGADQPRVDYLNDSNGALLLEPSRTNSLLQSNQFDTTWFIGGAALDLTGGQVGVGGSSDAWLLKKNTTGARYIQQSLSLPSAQYSYSVYLKAESTEWVWLFSSDGSSSVSAYFDLENGVVGITSGTNFNDAKIESVGDGWYRCTLIYTQATTLVRIYPADADGSVSPTSDNGIFIQYAQLEQGSYPTSYIPTSGSAVTRVYDTIPSYLDITPLNIGNSYTLFLDADLNVNDNNKVFSAINNSSDVISFTIRNNVGGIRLYNHIDASYPVSGITSSTNKFVIRVDGNSYKVFVQGSSLSGTLTTQRDLGSLNFYGQNTELKINNFTIDNTALSDAECQALVN